MPLSKLQNNEDALGNKDHASQLLAALLKTHFGEALAMQPPGFKPVQVLPNIPVDTTAYQENPNDPAQRIDALGSYNYETNRVRLKQPSNAHVYGKGSYVPSGETPTSLDTETLMNFLQTAAHELHHGRVAASRKRNWSDQNITKQVREKRGVSDSQIKSFQQDLQSTTQMPSAQMAGSPELALEEFLAYAVANQQMQRIQANTEMLRQTTKEVNTLVGKHPWLVQLMQDWERPELHEKAKKPSLWERLSK